MSEDEQESRRERSWVPALFDRCVVVTARSGKLYRRTNAGAGVCELSPHDLDVLASTGVDIIAVGVD